MTSQNNNSQRSDLRLVRGLASFIALVMIGLGVWSIATQHYFGSTNKFGGAEISLDGQPATYIGLLYILLRALPLAVWFRTPRVAVLYASICAVAAFVLLLVLLYG